MLRNFSLSEDEQKAKIAEVVAAAAEIGIVLPESLQLAGDLDTLLAGLLTARSARELTLARLRNNQRQGDGDSQPTQMSRRESTRQLTAAEADRVVDQQFGNGPQSNADKIIDQMHRRHALV